MIIIIFISYVPPTYFDLYKVIIREVYTKAYKYTRTADSAKDVCVCRVKILYCQLKLLKMFKI
jgi:hypothetical protein